MAWQSPDIPARQRQLVEAQLREMYAGHVVPVYQVLVEAVRATGCDDPTFLEIGCSSGYYSEVLRHLLSRQIKYVGVDYSPTFLAEARKYYPNHSFILGDACNLPIADRAVDIAISGCVLLHVSGYQKAIAETARITRTWAIFHRTPVVSHGTTSHFTKLAYGVRCHEIAFGEEEILSIFKQQGLRVERTLFIERASVVGDGKQPLMKTYLCRRCPA